MHGNSNIKIDSSAVITVSTFVERTWVAARLVLLIWLHATWKGMFGRKLLLYHNYIEHTWAYFNKN